MDEIRITLADVSNASANIKSINMNLDDTLATISRTMSELNSVWKGNAGETIVSNFNKFANRFIDESEVINDYAKYLDFTVSTYDSLESAITTNATNFG